VARGAVRPGACGKPSRSLAAELRTLAADLSTTKTVAFAPSGGGLTYTIVVSNVGTTSSATWNIADRFSESGNGSVSLLTPSVSSGSCSGVSPPTSATSNVQTFSCVGPPIGAGNAVTVIVPGTCATLTGMAWVITNTATATVGGDTNPANDAATRVATNCSAGATALRVSAFSARLKRGTVSLEWRTSTELDAAGFNVFRTGAGVTRRVNHSLVQARGRYGVGGSTYRLVDRALAAGRLYTYRLQVVGIDGSLSWFGSARVRVPH
jgi:hypothetical protein